MKTLNERQKAALLYHVFAGCKDRDLLFQIAEGEIRYNKLKDSSKRQTVSTWWNTDAIQQGIKEITYQVEKVKNEIREDERRKAEAEPANREPDESGKEKTNFLDRDEFLKFLNQRANQITDDKLRNDILKMLSDNLRYKDSDNNEVQEIQRFYTPVNCLECVIYNKCKGCNLPICPELA